ncbi:hypothetical protein IPG41_05755 [Candidatus Peregrinibacteria bacterium]|nr:MAG: hypothetical protein IPG41_05755 [Candidatus Peregrinibacteria bacterium]
MPNFILFFAGLFVLAFIALLWLRQTLMHHLDQLKHHQDILKKDLEKVRDLTPFLLEGAREGEGVTDAWNFLVQKRAAFLNPSSLAQDFEFEKDVQHFIANSTLKNVMYLEAKKDLTELFKLIQEQKEKMSVLIQKFNHIRKQFPYSLASGIFGIREVNPL